MLNTIHFPLRRKKPFFQTVRVMCLWEKLQGACVLEEFKRKEVQATSLAGCPEKGTFEKLFEDAASSVQEPSPAAPSHEKEAAKSLRVLLQRIDEVRQPS